MTITQASRTIFKNYLEKLQELFSTEKDYLKQKRLLQLISMCQTVIKNTSQYDNSENIMTEDKLSRWLGYVQGVMTVYGWITVEEERENTRPLFHKAYEDLGLLKPVSITASLDDIQFHIVDMQDFNNRCIEKYNCVSYKDLSEKKQLKICFKIMKEHKPLVYKTLKKLNYIYQFNRGEDNPKYTFVFTDLSLKK